MFSDCLLFIKQQITKHSIFILTKFLLFMSGGVSSSTKSHLNKGERIVYNTSLHWVGFIEPVSVVIIGLLFLYLSYHYREIIGEGSKYLEYISLGVLLYGGIKFMIEMVKHNASEFVVTTERVIIKVGVLKRSSLAMPLSKIESIEIDQSIMGRILNFGTIQITGTGTAESMFHHLSNPAKFRQKMQLASGSADEATKEAEMTNPRPVLRRRRR